MLYCWIVHEQARDCDLNYASRFEANRNPTLEKLRRQSYLYEAVYSLTLTQTSVLNLECKPQFVHFGFDLDRENQNGNLD